MRILMVTSFPIAGQTDGTAMLAIQVLRALKRRGLEVAHAYLKARRPWDVPFEGEFEGSPRSPCRRRGGSAAWRRSGGGSRSTSCTPSTTAGRPGRWRPAG